MDFDEHDDGDEEMPPMPVRTSTYDAPMQAPGMVLGGSDGGTPKPADSSGGAGGSFRTTTPAGGGGGGGAGGGTRYRECLKNHAAGIGGHALDGCGEFMAAGEEGSIDALRCAACGCHRNFHRKESGGGGSPTRAEPTAALSPAGITTTAYGAVAAHHHQFPAAYYRTPVGYLYHHQQQLAAGHMHRPLALPSTSHSGGGRDEGGDDVSGMIGPMVVAPMVGMSLGGPSGSGGSGSGRKRFRTKFTQEQKDRMLLFAERLGWRIQKHDEAAVQQFCEEVGVKRHVLKVWMHNNKHTLGRKPLP